MDCSMAVVWSPSSYETFWTIASCFWAAMTVGVLTVIVRARREWYSIWSPMGGRARHLFSRPLNSLSLHTATDITAERNKHPMSPAFAERMRMSLGRKKQSKEWARTSQRPNLDIFPTIQLLWWTRTERMIITISLDILSTSQITGDDEIHFWCLKLKLLTLFRLHVDRNLYGRQKKKLKAECSRGSFPYNQSQWWPQLSVNKDLF